MALILRQNNAQRLYGLNAEAETAGLRPGMTLPEARAYCPDLILRDADLAADRRLLVALQRWSMRYCPWVGFDGDDGLVLDITGSAGLAGGEAAMLADMQARAAQAGLSLRTGLADTRGAAWALARFAPGIAAPGQGAQALAPLPVAALRLPSDQVTGLQRLGLRRIGDLAATPRAPLARRFGRGVLDQLDRALGRLPDPVSGQAEPAPLAVRLTLPEPIGLVSDVMAGLERLLERLCALLRARDLGARALVLGLRRVDGAGCELPLRLAAPMRDPARILPLFARPVEGVDAGFGIDQMRLEAVQVEPLAPLQIGSSAAGVDRLDALLTRIGSRIGLDNIRRFRPLDSHIPEKSFALVPAASGPAPAPDPAPIRPDRPLTLFPPEPVVARGSTPPLRFRWRGMALTTARASGPERIAPEWWAEDDLGRGLRDYWKVETRQGRRLWMFHTPQRPGWFVQGEFL